MKSPFRRSYELQRAQVDTATTCLLFKSRLGTFFGGEPETNKYDRLRTRIVAQMTTNPKPTSIQTIELSPRQRRLTNRAARFVMTHADAVTADMAREEHGIQRFLKTFEQVERGYSNVEIQNRAERHTAELIIGASTLRVALSNRSAAQEMSAAELSASSPR